VVNPANRRAVVVLLTFSIAALGALALRVVGALDVDPRPSVFGVRLGMTADEVRERVDARGPGEWSSSVVLGDWVLEHRAGPEHARFEIHEGQLVAIRVEGPASSDLPTEPRFAVTPGSVLLREPEAGGVRITLLSRACPTHHEEAERLVAAHVTER
jgi:hypothetical protein